MNIYLDIDGTMLHEDRWDMENLAAEGLAEFITALRPHTTYWLTTHCRDGNPDRAREIMKRFLPPELHPCIDRIRPTTWDRHKTEGIDWSQDFIWFDNDISDYEWEQIKQGSEGQQAIEVNLKQNAEQLIEITRDVLDVFEAAGLDKPEFPILSDEFLAEIQGMQRKNLAVEALKKLLNDEIKGRFGKNAIKLIKFSELLEDALQRYKSGTVEAAQVVEMLVELAKEMRKEADAAESMGLSADEKAFYDALIENGSALDVLGDEKLRALAQLLVQRVRNNISVDWQYREPAKARLRVEVKKLLQEFGYPPDQQAVATQLILEQSKLFAEDWSKE